ncbi:LANO_0A03510g1_1 [Lachancea nothofagi CBS 11611]|uniref:LANO_0A03510g1_1 n=1 Tax=Lachancea nothofagi CBS 11611 TaxID=1266666 RepID=A0A1G4IQ73_9SACH|nr:LANO_0A03510g1_1 [Lachancea nothofagi CBS 11611]
MTLKQSNARQALPANFQPISGSIKDDTKQLVSKRKQFRSWLHNLKEQSFSGDISDDETVFVDIEDACLSSANPLSYVPVLSATEAELLIDPRCQPKDQPHGRRLKTFLREHLKRPSRRSVKSSRRGPKQGNHEDNSSIYSMQTDDFEITADSVEDAEKQGATKSLSNPTKAAKFESLSSVHSGISNGSQTVRLSSKALKILRNPELKTDVNKRTEAPRPRDNGEIDTRNPPENNNHNNNNNNNNMTNNNNSDDDDNAHGNVGGASRKFKTEFIVGHNNVRIARKDLAITAPGNSEACDTVEKEASRNNNSVSRFGAGEIEATKLKAGEAKTPLCLDSLSKEDAKQESLKRSSEAVVGSRSELKRPCIDKELDEESDKGNEDDCFSHDSSSAYSDTPSFDKSTIQRPSSLANNPQMMRNPYTDDTSDASEIQMRQSTETDHKPVVTKDAREPANYLDTPKVKTPKFTPLSKLNKDNSEIITTSPIEDKIYGVVEKLKSVVHHQQVTNNATGSGVNANGSRSNSVKRRQPFKPSKSEDFETQRLRVPTFRQSLRKIDALGLFEDVRNGTLTERDLFHLSKTKLDEPYDFRDSRFFDEQSSPSDTSNISKALYGENLISSVKFDKFSQLLMYDVRKTSRFERPETSQSFKAVKVFSRDGRLSRSLSDSAADVKRRSYNHRRPILKRKTNDRAGEESLRAEDCDRVDVNVFLKFFENHEARRRTEENRLSKIRAQQLTNYYANDHMYNSVQNGDVKTAMIDFKRSKKATEINIGRELQDPNKRIMSCPREVQWQKMHKESSISQSCF